MIDVTFSIQDSQELNAIFKDTEHQFFSFINSLDIGNISCDFAGEQRKACLSTLICTAYNAAFTETLNKDWDENQFCFDKLKQARISGEDVYIWYHAAPEAVCGMYCIVDYFAGRENNIYIIKLPKYQDEKSVIAFCDSWYQYNFRKIEIPVFIKEHAFRLSMNIRRMITAQWKNLKFQNAMLRVSINETVISVDESFYDIFIISQLKNQVKKVIDVITEVFNLKMYIPQWWIERRILFLIKKNTIIICKKNTNFYIQQITLGGEKTCINETKT